MPIARDPDLVRDAYAARAEIFSFNNLLGLWIPLESFGSRTAGGVTGSLGSFEVAGSGRGPSGLPIAGAQAVSAGPSEVADRVKVVPK